MLALNSTSSGFSQALKELDHVSTRTQDTVYVFYVKAEQTDAHEIIENQVSIISVIFTGMNEPY